MGSFSNTKGIAGVIGSLNGKFDAFPPTKPFLKYTKHSSEFATQGYLESKVLEPTCAACKL